MFDAITVAGEWIGPIELVDRFIEFLMRLSQFARHNINIIQISKRRVGILRTSIENCLSERFSLLRTAHQ